MIGDLDAAGGPRRRRRGRRHVRRTSTSPTPTRSTRCSRTAKATYGCGRHRLQQRRHLAARRRLDPRHRHRRLAPGAGGQPDAVYLCCKAALPYMLRAGQGLDHQHRVVRRGDGRGDVADLLHRVQGRRAGDDPRARRAVRPRGHPGQRAVPRAGQHPAAAGAVRQGPGAGRAPAGAHPDGPVRRARGDRRRRAFLASDESSLHHRVELPGRRSYLPSSRFASSSCSAGR